MAGRNPNTRSARQKFSVDLPASTGWSTPQLVTLGKSGRLARSVLRAPALSTATQVGIMVWHGDVYHEERSHEEIIRKTPPVSNVTNPLTAVPEEDRVLYRNTITVAGSAITADDDYNILTNHEGAIFDQRDKDDFVWVSVQTEVGTAQLGVTLVLEAIEVE